MLRDPLRKIETFHRHVERFGSRLLPDARQIVQANRSSYEGGKTGFLDLVLSERSLRELEAMSRAHLADTRIAVAELEALGGADLHLFSQLPKISKRKSK